MRRIVGTVWLAVSVSAACGGDSRGTVESGLDISQARMEVHRSNGSMDEVVEEEIFLYPGNYARIFLTVVNESDGWWPINFETCSDNTESIIPMRPGGTFEPPEDLLVTIPCIVLQDFGTEWLRSSEGETEEFLAGAVYALEQPSGGYLCVHFRIEMPEGDLLDIIDYGIPYRVLPSSEEE